MMLIVVFVDVMIPMFELLFVRVMALVLFVRVMALVLFVRVMAFVLFVRVMALVLLVRVMAFVIFVRVMALVLLCASWPSCFCARHGRLRALCAHHGGRVFSFAWCSA